MQGSSGFVEIKLKSGIIPEAVTLEHVSKVRFLATQHFGLAWLCA
jgi:SUN domain-containing protein 1/2